MSSRVLLANDLNSKIPIIIEPSGINAILSGNGNDEYAELEYLPKDNEIKENEIVASDGAQIPFTSTDQKGNFDIGEGIQINQTTSTITGRDFSRAIQAEVTPLILALR